MKKLFSFALVCCLLLTTAVPAFAAEGDSKGLEKAILAVKKVVSIPSTYKVFNYSSNEYEHEDEKIALWSLYWSTEEGDKNISATVDMEGRIISYYSYENRENDGLGKTAKEEALKIAQDFISKAMPDVAKKIKLREPTDGANTYQYSYTFKLYENEIGVDFAKGYVEVDKFSGKVIHFSGIEDYSFIKNLPNKENIIGSDAAKKAYLDQIGIKLSYYSHFDYKTKKLTVFPAYHADGMGWKAIDGKTGKAVELYLGQIFYDKGGMAGMANENASVSEEEFSKEELEALENMSSLISKGKAEDILRTMVPGITAGMKVTNTSLSKNYIEQNRYNWEIGFDGAYGIVDAKTGELISFYIYQEDSTKGNQNLSREKAREKGESFLKEMAPERFGQSAFSERKNYSARAMDDSKVTDYSFNYSRQVNGIPYQDNGFSITVNKASGMITQYTQTWYEGIQFPAVDNIITQEEAFAIVNKTANFDLSYKKISAKEVALVYDFTDRADFLINPKTGAKMGWDGKAYKETTLPVYSDLKGHWSEKTVNSLLENGYYILGDKFNPNNKITQIQFLRYLYTPEQSYYEDDDLYRRLISDKIIKENEKNPNAELARQDAAKFMVRYLGQGKSAEHPEIFNNPFKDSVAISYKGYAAISYGLGIMKGDGRGRFNGTKAMTNAEAAVVIYNGLQAK